MFKRGLLILIMLSVLSVGAFGSEIYPEVIYIYKDGCPPCDRMEEDLWSTLSDDFVLTRVELFSDEYKELLKNHESLKPVAPQTIVNQVVYTGYSEDRVSTLRNLIFNKPPDAKNINVGKYVLRGTVGLLGVLFSIFGFNIVRDGLKRNKEKL